MDRFAELTGRRYRLFDYHGAPDAERVIVLMGSGCEAAHETVDYLTARGEKVGVLKVRLYRPFDVGALRRSAPANVKAIAVLDRTKEPGSAGEPLYLDCVNALHETGRGDVRPVVGGRYGLSSKEFTPAMVKAVFDNLAAHEPQESFHRRHQRRRERHEPRLRSEFSVESDGCLPRAVLRPRRGRHGGREQDSIKIIGEDTANYAQGYFVYDSKKSGAITVSHLRFGPRPIRSTYLIGEANFVGCHQPFFLERYDMLESSCPAARFLLNTPFGPERRLGAAA